MKECTMCKKGIDDVTALDSHEQCGKVLCNECQNREIESSKKVSTEKYEVDTIDVNTKTSKVELEKVQTSYTRQQIDTLKKTVAKDATDEEFQMLMYNSSKYGLDPFIKEIFFIKNVGIVASRDGYLKAAQRDKNFRGLLSMAVFENDNFEIDAANATVSHKFGMGDRGHVIGAWAIAKHAERDNVVTYVPFSEYVKQSAVWKQYPSAMIQKVAESRALKQQFGLSGLVTTEEIGF